MLDAEFVTVNGLLFFRNTLIMHALSMSDLSVASKHSTTAFLTIAVEGNIASGKSTVVQKLADLPQVTTFLEPLPFWQRVGKHHTNLLDLFYQDQVRWFALLQSYISLTFLRIHDENVKTPLKILERSFFSAEVFIDQMLKTTKIHPVDLHLIQSF
jgi:deoxyadenosine/deoxycytidine kinase